MNSIRDFSKDTIVYGIGYALKKFIGFFLLPFYARALTPDNYGILDTLSVSIMLLSIFLNLGITNAASRYFYEAKNGIEKGRILFTAFILNGFTMIPSLILAAFSREISLVLFKTQEYTWVVFLSCMIIPITLLGDEQSWIYRFFKRPWRFNSYIIIKTLSNLGFGLFLVILLKKGVLGAQLASGLSGLIAILFSFLSFSRKKYMYSFSWAWAKKMVKFGYPLMFSGIIAWVYAFADRFFLLHYHDAAEIGLYSIGAVFARPLSVLNMAVSMSFFPFFMSLYESETGETKFKTKKTANNIWHLYLILSISLSLFLSIFSTTLIRFVATPVYIMGSIAVPFLLFSRIARQSTDIIALGMFLREKTYHYVWMIALTSLVSVTLNFLLIPRYSLLGAAISNLVSNLIYFVSAFSISQIYFPNKVKIFKVIVYLITAFMIAIYFPISELLYNIKSPTSIKILFLLIGLTLPFIINLIEISNFESIIKNLKGIVFDR